MIKFRMGTNGIHGMSENLEDYGSVVNKGLVKRGKVVDWDDDESVLVEMNSEENTLKENKLLNVQRLYNVEDQPMEETIVHDIRVLENDAENNKVKAVEEEEVKNEDEEIRAEEHKAETAIESIDEQAGTDLTEHEEIRDVAEQAQSENNGVKVMEEKSETDIRMAEELVKYDEKDVRDVKLESEDNEVRVMKDQNESKIIMGANERAKDGNEDITGAKKKAESDNNEIKVLEAQAETGNKVSFEQCDTEYRTPDKKLGQEGEQANARSHLSSLSDLSKLDQWDFGSLSQRGLDHCITAPIGTIGIPGNSLIDNYDVNLSRSKTQKESPFDRLSEREKRKLIVNLVKIQKDGTVEVDITRNAPVASELLELQAVERAPVSFDDCTPEVKRSIPRLKIAMLVVGTRGDVQPFLAMAKRLQEFGHCVRLATHTNFREFVKSAGVEFYPLGGDPRVLAGYMARNKGFIPSGPGEISIQRKQIKQIIESLLPACTEADMETGAPFRAQAVIANPPAYGHAHVAEALGVPIHIFFTMPWTPTYEFPHPLARVPQSAGNWLSYTVVDLLIWWGIRSYINDFRKRKLKLAPIAYFSMYSGSISHLPTGYMWSPYVVPKPNDWGSLVDVVGYCFLNLGAKYEPREDFVKWIAKGSKPIYIGFGSMPLEDPKKTTSIILEALKDTGQRGILDRGWGDLGIFSETPDYIFLLENCPHDWLFPQCSAVVHHGGAGTTATGLKAGCPTTVVPFFGDQFFWGDRIHQKGLGPEPIPIAQLTVESLSNAITYMLQPEVKSRAIEIAKLIENEDGVAAAVDSFHKHLPPELPLPPASLDENDHPSAVQWLFGQIGRLCCLPCS